MIKVPCKLYTSNNTSTTIDLSRNTVIDLSVTGSCTLWVDKVHNRGLLGKLIIIGDGSSKLFFRGDSWRFTSSNISSGRIFENGETVVIGFSTFNYFIYPYFDIYTPTEEIGNISNISVSESSGTYSLSYDYDNEANEPPVITDAYITGASYVEGQTLTAVVTNELKSPYSFVSYTYQWYRSDDQFSTNRVAISGATGPTYVLTLADAGKVLDFEVIMTQSGGINNVSDTYISRKTTEEITAIPPATVSIITNFRRDSLAAGAAKPPDTAINELTHVTTSIGAGSVVDNLGNVLAGVGLSITNVGGLPGLDDGNLVSNTTRFSDESLDTHLDVVKGTNETLTISGLNDANTYAVELMCTQSAGSSINRLGIMTAGGVSGTQKTTGTIDALNNTTTVTLTGLNTDGAGNLLVVFSGTGTAASNNWLPLSSIAIDFE